MLLVGFAPGVQPSLLMEFLTQQVTPKDVLAACTRALQRAYSDFHPSMLDASDGYRFNASELLATSLFLNSTWNDQLVEQFR